MSGKKGKVHGKRIWTKVNCHTWEKGGMAMLKLGSQDPDWCDNVMRRQEGNNEPSAERAPSRCLRGWWSWEKGCNPSPAFLWQFLQEQLCNCAYLNKNKIFLKSKESANMWQKARVHNHFYQNMTAVFLKSEFWNMLALFLLSFYIIYVLNKVYNSIFWSTCISFTLRKNNISKNYWYGKINSTSTMTQIYWHHLTSHHKSEITTQNL